LAIGLSLRDEHKKVITDWDSWHLKAKWRRRRRGGCGRMNQKSFIGVNVKAK
jgi:hypothetical protein